MCTLSALTEFEISDNYFLNESKTDVFESCSHITATPDIVHTYYRNNRVDFFSNILTMFPSIANIFMSNNSMRFIKTDKFVDNFSVLRLELDR